MFTSCGNGKATGSGESTSAQSSTQSASKEEKPSSEVASSAESSEAFDPKSVTEGVTLTIATPSNATVEDFETNETTKMIQEHLGLELDFLVFPKDDYGDKLNLIIQSGDKLPDIIFNPNKVMDLCIDEELVVPLNDYYSNPNYSANIMAASERTGVDIPQFLKTVDGNIYNVPSFSQSVSNTVSHKLWIYKPWLDELGLDVPTTTDEYLDVCRKVIAQDMNGNGKADEMAITGNGLNQGWFSTLMNSFIYASDDHHLVANDGKVSYAYTTEEWKEGLKYLNTFFAEGLIPTETLTMNEDEFKTIWFAETPQLLSFSYWFYGGSDLSRGVEYVWVTPLKGPKGVQNTAYYPQLPTYKTGATITVDCENPDAAFLVCDYMCDETISAMQRWGQEGVDWDYWDKADVPDKSVYEAAYPGYDISILCYDDAAWWGSGDPQNRSYRQTGPMIRSENMICGLATKNVTETEEEAVKLEFARMKADAITKSFNYIPDEVVDKVLSTAEESVELSEIQANLTTYMEEYTCAVLTGQKNIDSTWDAYLAELNNIGIDRAIELYQIGYDRAHQ